MYECVYIVLQDGMKGETLFVAVNILDRVASRQRIAGMHVHAHVCACFRVT